MKTLLSTVIALALLQQSLRAQEADEWRVTRQTGVRFVSVAVWVDSGAQPLAAYQIAFTAKRGDVKVVGIEGGEHPAFQNPPFYDPKALQHDKVILAAFNTAPTAQLPHGVTRVATLHLQVSGSKPPRYVAKLEAAANATGQSISAKVSLEERPSSPAPKTRGS